MTTLAHTAPHSRLAHFPISFFSMVMGLAGLAIALHKGAALWPVIGIAASITTGLSLVLFVVLAAIYLLKVMQHPADVAAEFSHPVRLHFSPAISISLLLASIAVAPLSNSLSLGLLLVGAPLHLVMTLLVIDRWLNRDMFQIAHVNPAWFIPIVGNIVVPIAAVGHGYKEISWLFFAIGITFWLPMLGLMLHRLILTPMLPERLRPTLAVLITPPAVGFMSYMKLTGSFDATAHTLFYFGLFMLMILFMQAPRLMRIPFFLSWWAYSFPLAAATVSIFVMHEQTGMAFFAWLGFVLLAISLSVITGLLIRTAIAAWRGEICQPE